MIRQLLTVVALVTLFAATVAEAGFGIRNSKAPSWGVSEWINLPEGKESLDVDDFKDKVVFLYGFQTWCPGCHKYGFPTLTKLIEHFEGVEDVAFVAVQTAFEGHGVNNAEGAWQTAERYGLRIPVGHSGDADRPSELMRGYRTGGTPWVVIIDKQGAVRFDHFRIKTDYAVNLIEHYRKNFRRNPAKPYKDPVKPDHIDP